MFLPVDTTLIVPMIAFTGRNRDSKLVNGQLRVHRLMRRMGPTWDHAKKQADLGESPRIDLFEVT